MNKAITGLLHYAFCADELRKLPTGGAGRLPFGTARREALTPYPKPPTLNPDPDPYAWQLLFGLARSYRVMRKYVGADNIWRYWFCSWVGGGYFCFRAHTTPVHVKEISRHFSRHCLCCWY